VARPPRFRVAVLLGGQARHDGLLRARGDELARRVLVAIDRGPAGVVEPAVLKGDVTQALRGIADLAVHDEVVGVDQRTETRGQHQAAVVRVGRRQRGRSGDGDGQGEGATRAVRSSVSMTIDFIAGAIR
jgi:hypothetical protein